eukprot:5803156-Pyramimonas_sp.AAC.1
MAPLWEDEEEDKGGKGGERDRDEGGRSHFGLQQRFCLSILACSSDSASRSDGEGSEASRARSDSNHDGYVGTTIAIFFRPRLHELRFTHGQGRGVRAQGNE